MDTRRKLLSATEAQKRLANGNWLVFAGYFDPLTTALAQRLDELSGSTRISVLAVVLHGTETLMTVEARSTLMAALRRVDAVVAIPESELDRLVPGESRIRFVFDREEERRNTEAFTELILSKTSQAAHSDGKVL